MGNDERVIIKPGEKVAILASTGSGKTVFARTRYNLKPYLPIPSRFSSNPNLPHPLAEV